MASSMPYDPEAEVNPFAEETSSSPYVARSYDERTESAAPVPEERPEETTEARDTATSEEATTEGPKEPEQTRPGGNSVAGSDSKGPKGKTKKYKLITKITGLERNGKKDPIIRFDAYTTLPRFRTTTFKDIRRTHGEFVKLFDHLNGNNAECFVPSVPPAVTSAGAGTEEDEAKIKLRMQLWLDRVTSNPILARDEEFVYFIEADFGYAPVVKKKPPATGLTRKTLKQFQPPPDEVTELHEFRPLVKQVYLHSTETLNKLEKATKCRRHLGLGLTDFGAKLGSMADLESHNGMANMWRKLGKVMMALGDLEAVKATSEAASLGDGITWVAKDAYVAKEALTNRHLLMRDLIKAQAATKARHQTAARVKGSTNISPLKVDEAITALEEAAHHEEALTNKLQRVSNNMLIEKGQLLSRFEQDIRNYIGEYVFRMIESERRALSTWESVRLDVRAADSNGGLSRLGREATPASKRATMAASQGPRGDSWSGDRHQRATEYDPTAAYRKDEPDSDHEAISDSEETAVDARNAASLLAGSTF
ncbi:vacuolar protein sorting-associated protein 17 [Trichomonascus vanleenenianus]|uniref:retromer subunit VPS17 n=1 Tax=Trichomonascus vanleenenianus TaxID=2268995 RepID=UPI003EC980D9